ncbi:MAG: AAA family ATPase [Spirochaetes bacterium]|nr:AAA family ATPase [Spirochaetota bacterium]
MRKIIISSVRNNAGKTSVIAGIISSINKKKFAYAKPFGDRLIFRRKKSWDHDASLIVNLLGNENSFENRHEDLTISFAQSASKSMVDTSISQKTLSDMVTEIGGSNDILFIETGGNFTQGSYLHLDAASIAEITGGKLVIVVNWDNATILDDITFIKNFLSIRKVTLGGIIVNKVSDMDTFENAHLPVIKEMGIHLFGVIPFKEQLTYCTVGYLADLLKARVLAGKSNLHSTVKNIIIGALSADNPDENLIFNSPDLIKENQVIITGGDRTDLILAALKRDIAGIILTNDIVPSRFVISRAKDNGIPLLLAATDTFNTARIIDSSEILLTEEDKEKIDLLSQLAEKNINLDELLK